MACAKHYIGYGESTGARDSADSQITRRKLMEVFMPPFEKAVATGCLSVMAGYESIDGLPCSASPWLLKDTLLESVKLLVLFGESKFRIEKDLGKEVETVIAFSLE